MEKAAFESEVLYSDTEVFTGSQHVIYICLCSVSWELVSVRDIIVLNDTLTRLRIADLAWRCVHIIADRTGFAGILRWCKCVLHATHSTLETSLNTLRNELVWSLGGEIH